MLAAAQHAITSKLGALNQGIHQSTVARLILQVLQRKAEPAWSAVPLVCDLAYIAIKINAQVLHAVLYSDDDCGIFLKLAHMPPPNWGT
jgi:hypothetical protein